MILLLASFSIGIFVGYFLAKHSILKPTQTVPEAEERFKLLTEHMAASVILKTTSGKALFCSPYTEVLTGHPVVSFLESDDDFLLSLVHAEDKEKYIRSSQIVLQGDAFQFRFRLLHRSGIEMWIEARVVPITDNTGETTATLAILLDVTGPVRYQKQVESRNRELQDFSYMISHDLKSPLFTIKGMLGIIKEEYLEKLEPELKEVIEHIGTAHSRLESLVTGILEYSRATSEHIEEEAVSLQGLFNDIQKDYSPLLASHGGIISLESTQASVLGNKTKLYQVLSNLVGNAIKYRDPAKKLTISLSAKMNDQTRRVNVTVTDNGLGIPENKISEVFRPFQRAHKHTEGSGVGLAIVATLVERMSGEISVKSKEGEGSTFSIILRSM